MSSKKRTGDVVHALTKGVLSGAPVVGGLVSEIFALAFSPPLEKRREEWLLSLEKRLRSLELKLEMLAESEIFVSMIQHATQIALRTHQADKLEALRNAVVNTAQGSSLEDDLRSIFLNLIDSMTPWHIRLLKFWKDPQAYADTSGIRYAHKIMTSGEELLLMTFPELNGKADLYKLVMRDLYRWGLVQSDNLHMMSTMSGVLAKGGTPLGNKFLEFIS